MRKIYNTLLCFSMLVFTFIFSMMIKTVAVHAANGSIVGSSTGTLSNTGGGSGGGGTATTVIPIAYGYRISVVDSTGKQVKNSADYWSNISAYNNKYGTYHAYDGLVKAKETGGGVINNAKYYTYYSTKTPKTVNSKNLIRSSSKYDTEFNKDTFIGTESGYLGDWSNVQSGEEVYNNNLSKYVLNKMKDIIENAPENASADYYSDFIKFLKDCGFTGSNEEILISVKDKYMLVEPLIAITKSTVKNVAYIGTMKELLDMGFYGTENWKFSYNYYSYYNPFVYYSGDENVAGINSCSDVEEPTRFANKDLLGVSGCAGVFVVTLSEISTQNCSSLVLNLIEKNTLNEENINKLESDYVSDSAKEWLINYESYGFNKTTLKDYLSNSDNQSCPEPSCNESAQNFENLTKFRDNYPYIRKYREQANREGKKSNFDLIAAGINNVTNDSEGKYCSASSCEYLFNNNKNETSIDKLDSIFNNGSLKYPLLNKEFREELGIPLNEITGDKACKQIPKCDPGDVTASCASGTSNTINTITFTDNQNKLEECVKSGYAYTISSGDVVTKVQSSKESDYNLDTYGNVYCSERVDINLPRDVKTKAGNLLAWGNNNQDSDVFGTMELKRTCYFPELYTKNRATIKSEWIDDINPFIQINYEQALPEGMTSQTLNERLGIRKRLFKIEDTAGFDNYNYTMYDVDGTEQYCDVNGKNCQSTWHDSNNPTTITCTRNSCNKLNSNFAVTFTLDYDIIYNDTLKWYSNKSNHFEYSTSSEITSTESEIKNNYTYIGYGLPTSFSTATTCLNTKYGYIKDSGEGVNGKLYLTIKNIGTKNSSGGYHFDKIISTKYHVTDDSNGYTIMENDQRNESLVYSCGFTIQNELFGYEDGDGSSETCDNKPPKGIDVVFRTVDLVSSDDDLTKAFPGRSGTGRKKGRNWAELDDEEVVQILSNDIYDREPLYEITLNSSLIQKIRSANNKMRANDKDPYSDMTDETKQGSVATESNGYSGYQFLTDEDGIVHSYSAFLYNLAHTIQCDGQGCLKQKATTCINSSGQHTMNCYQQWWNE